MIADHRGHVIKIADFLSCNLSDHDINLVVEKSKGELSKGKAGKWVKFFSDEQNQFVDNRCQQLYAPLGIPY